MDKEIVKIASDSVKGLVDGISRDTHVSLAAFIAILVPAALIGVAYIFRGSKSEIFPLAIVGAFIIYAIVLLIVQRQSLRALKGSLEDSSIEKELAHIRQEIAALSLIIVNASAQLSFAKALERHYGPGEFYKFWTIMVASSSKTIRAINGLSPATMMRDGALEETFKILAAHNVQLRPLDMRVTMERVFIIQKIEDLVDYDEVFRLHVKYGVQFHVFFVEGNEGFARKNSLLPLAETFMLCDDCIAATFTICDGEVVDIWPKPNKATWEELDRRYTSIKDASIQYSDIPQRLPVIRRLMAEELS